MVHVAVLGGTGRTGQLVVSELLQRGHDVTALVRTGQDSSLPSTVRQLEGDARDLGAAMALIRDCDAVCSALGSRTAREPVNAAAARVLIVAMRTQGVHRFVGISGAGMLTVLPRPFRLGFDFAGTVVGGKVRGNGLPAR